MLRRSFLSLLNLIPLSAAAKYLPELLAKHKVPLASASLTRHRGWNIMWQPLNSPTAYGAWIAFPVSAEALEKTTSTGIRVLVQKLARLEGHTNPRITSSCKFETDVVPESKPQPERAKLASLKRLDDLIIDTDPWVGVARYGRPAPQPGSGSFTEAAMQYDADMKALNRKMDSETNYDDLARSLFFGTLPYRDFRPIPRPYNPQKCSLEDLTRMMMENEKVAGGGFRAAAERHEAAAKFRLEHLDIRPVDEKAEAARIVKLAAIEREAKAKPDSHF